MNYNSIPAWTMDPIYQNLKKEVTLAGLLEKTPFMHLAIFALSFIVLTTGLIAVTYLENSLTIAIAAILIALPRVWIGYIGHDISHGQVFASRKISYAIGIFVWNLLVGLQMTSWERNHHPHHHFTNKIGFDPDVDNPFVFSDKQSRGTNIFEKNLPFFSRNQHLYFWVLLPILHSTRILRAFRYILTEKKDVYFYLEYVLVWIHYIFFFSFAFYFLGFWNGALFLSINYFGVALMSGLAFAPNHKGQPMLGPNEEVTYRTQVTSSRNLQPSPVIDFLYGGLNYQIEHHLFTQMSRFQYPKARPLIRKFCDAQGLPYHETSTVGSLKEMYSALREFAK